jgi:hypothetical protein
MLKKCSLFLIAIVQTSWNALALTLALPCYLQVIYIFKSLWVFLLPDLAKPVKGRLAVPLSPRYKDGSPLVSLSCLSRATLVSPFKCCSAMILLIFQLWTVFHSYCSECHIEWGKVSNKEEVDTSRKL